MNILLNDLLTYTNDSVFERYKKDYPSSRLTPQKAMREFLKYVWLVLKHQSDCYQYPNILEYEFDCMMHEEMKDIDDLWHTFLLFTEDYHEFCLIHLDGIFFSSYPLSTR